MPPTTSLWYDRISHISQTDWYGICAAIALGSWLVWRLASRWGWWAVRWHMMQIRRLLAHPLPRPFPHFDMATVQQGSIVALLLTVNILPLAVQTRSWTAVHRRAANLAVINVVPLWTGWTFGLPAHLLGIDWSAVAWMHRWIGRMVIVQTVLHSVIAILGDGHPARTIRQHYVPLLAACSMIVIGPVTLHAMVRRYPQLAMKGHYLLGTTGLAATSYHVWMRRSKCLWYLVAAAALWMFLSLISVAVTLRRRWGHAWPSVVISRHDELLSMDITVPSGWTVEPGQYVYLWLPQAGLRIASQLALFYVSSWEETPGPNDPGARASQPAHLPGQPATADAPAHSASDENTWSDAETLVPDTTSLRSAHHREERRQDGVAAGPDAAAPTTSRRHGSSQETPGNTARGHRTLRVLARPQSSALAAALYGAEPLHGVQHRALVLGPYGRLPDLAGFGMVLLVVEDVGITRVFSLIQTLVLASEQHRALVRKLIVVWQMKDLDNRRWVDMQHLLDLDRQEFKILQFLLYYHQNRINEPSRNPGTRIRLHQGSVDVTQTLATHLDSRKGRMLVGVCAGQSIRNQVKAIVLPELSDDLRLLDLDMEPYHRWLDTDPTVADTTRPSRNHVQWVASRIAEGRGHSR